jgi:hypothetical protein
MRGTFSFSKQAWFAATAIWSCEWIAVGCMAVLHLNRFSGPAEYANVAIAGLMAFLGIFLTGRSVRRNGAGVEVGGREGRFGLWGRVGSWLVAVIWIVAGFVLNLAVTGLLIGAAGKGRLLNLLVGIPFSLIGLFLLLVAFAAVGVALDSLLGLGDQSTFTGPATPLLASLAQNAQRNSVKVSPVLGTLLAISMLNWLVFFGVSIHQGGVALGTLPTRDGFIVTSHGRHTVVSESTWKFSLYYSGATLLLTPSIWILFATLQFRRRVNKSNRIMALLIGGFVLFWAVGWYSGIGHSLLRSIDDFNTYKRRELQTPPAPARPDAGVKP